MTTVTLKLARHLWLHAQALTSRSFFGEGSIATHHAIRHLGYVQIDTINVIERAHHHILFTRIPDYRREDLHHAQSVEKSIFEYWTHALSYVPVESFPHYVRAMKRSDRPPLNWYGEISPQEIKRVVRRIKNDGALSIRDIEDEELVEKDHPWASKKPSKRLLQYAFYTGLLAISARSGMVKTYELIDRHFGWARRPRAATERETLRYLLDRALRSQGIVSIDSICYMNAPMKAAMRAFVASEVRGKRLVPVEIEGCDAPPHWVRPELLDSKPERPEPLVHILSPFDPLVIQRKRLELFFGYEHRFEAYVPKEKRVFGYFGLPVLVGDEIVAVLDLKTDRARGKLLVQKWTWVGTRRREYKPLVEEELTRFERFQLARPAS